MRFIGDSGAYDAFDAKHATSVESIPPETLTTHAERPASLKYAFNAALRCSIHFYGLNARFLRNSSSFAAICWGM